jgi:hypothetical protein
MRKDLFVEVAAILLGSDNQVTQSFCRKVIHSWRFPTGWLRQQIFT